MIETGYEVVISWEIGVLMKDDPPKVEVWMVRGGERVGRPATPENTRFLLEEAAKACAVESKEI